MDNKNHRANQIYKKELIKLRDNIDEMIKTQEKIEQKTKDEHTIRLYSDDEFENDKNKIRHHQFEIELFFDNMKKYYHFNDKQQYQFINEQDLDDYNHIHYFNRKSKTTQR